MLNITDLSLLKITKVRDYAIFFNYKNKHYFLHGTGEYGEETQVLYERKLNAAGNYKLTKIKSISFAKENVKEDYIKRQIGKTIVYKQIDKEYFVYKLTKRGFAIGIMEEKVKSKTKHIEKIRKQITEYNDKIRLLQAELKDLI